MALADLDDVKRFLSRVASSVTPRITIGSADTDSISETDAQAFLDAAEDEVILVIGYEPQATPFVRDLVARLAACTIYRVCLRYSEDGDVPDFAREELCERAFRDLERIRNGEISIPPATSGENVPALATLSSQVREVWWEKAKLDEFEFTKLDHDDIVRGTVQVYSGDSFSSTQYTEGTDYEVIYPTGEIRRLSGSNISDGATVYVCYCYMVKSPFGGRLPSIDWGLL